MRIERAGNGAPVVVGQAARAPRHRGTAREADTWRP